MSKEKDNDPQAGQGRPLPKKETDLFKSLVKFYETKQYKKGLKAADSILKKYPSHGETLCMKGLIFNSMQRRDDAHALVKQGLMKDMKSHVCWHVYGLLYRSDRNYNEAIKAYKHALKIDRDNLQILRDMSLLQIQMRDLNGFLVTRHAILQSKANQKFNWVALALAKHLLGDARGAISVIDIYLSTLSEDSPELDRGYESSELALYRNSILAEVSLEEAYDHLEQCHSIVVDEGDWLFRKASYLLEMKQYNDARRTFLLLLRRGHTEDYEVHTGYMCALLKLTRTSVEEAYRHNKDKQRTYRVGRRTPGRGTETLATMVGLTDDQRSKLLEAYQQDLPSQLPHKSAAVRRIPLTLMRQDALRDALDKYICAAIVKGVPSLGHDLSALLLKECPISEPTSEGFTSYCIRASDPVDVQQHEVMALLIDLTDGYLKNLEMHGKFHEDDEEEQSPSSILWTWYLRAYLFELCGDFAAGVKMTDKCLEHTPTAVDVYELKARLLQRGGALVQAAECLDTGRELDKQDRYINNQTTSYLLRAGRDDVAKQRIALFTRHEGNPEQNLYDVQCIWYELNVADCYLRKKQYGKALKKYMAVDKHFEDFHEDQFDFHSYCIRKVTMRTYVDILRFEDEIWGQEYYCHAAEGIVRIYLLLFDNPKIRADESSEPDYSGMTAAQKKRAKAVARKKKKAAEKKKGEEEDGGGGGAQNGGKKKEDGEKASSSTSNNASNASSSAAQSQPLSPVEQDPNGEEFLKREPLEEAKRFSTSLVTHAPNRATTWLLRYDVSMRREKELMAVQALWKARSILGEDSGEVISRIVDFVSRRNKGRPKEAEGGEKEEEEHGVKEKKAMVEAVVAETTTELLGGASCLEDYVKAGVERIRSNCDSMNLGCRAAVAGAAAQLEVLSVLDAAALVMPTAEGEGRYRGETVESCLETWRRLPAWATPQVVEEFRAKVQARFPLMEDSLFVDE